MKIVSYDNYINKQTRKKNWLALGNFDGVHKAHEKILRDAVKWSEKYNFTPGVLLFDPHPEVYFNGKKDFLLTSFDEKIEKIRKCGIKLAITKSFGSEFASKPPYEFVKWTIQKLNAVGVSIGYDFTFGKKKLGRADDMIAFGRALGFFTSTVPPVKTPDGIPVSSSLCRELLKKGKPEKAMEYLSEPYSITGKVIKGDGRGRKLGFPTANISPPLYKLLPKRGVYLVKVKKDDQMYWGICNIGKRPTFDKRMDNIEIHLLDFNGSIYDQHLRLYFISYIRPEISFTSSAELVHQMEQDLNFARNKILKTLH